MRRFSIIIPHESSQFHFDAETFPWYNTTIGRDASESKIAYSVRERMARLTAAGWVPAPEGRSTLAVKAIRTR